MTQQEAHGSALEVIGFLNQAVDTQYADDIMCRNTTTSHPYPVPSDEMITAAKKYMHKGLKHGNKIKISVNNETLTYIMALYRISKRYKVIDKVFTVPMYVDSKLPFGVVSIKATHHAWQRFKILKATAVQG